MTFITDPTQSLAGADLPAARSVPWSGRVRSLDGLRGVAALIVVVHHALLTSPTLARVNYGALPRTVHGFLWWMSYTPLHLIWAGPEAVFVFFVLSGFVLFLPTEAAPFRWTPYYPRRLLRLYLPVIGSVLFAWFTVLVVPPRAIRGASLWLVHHRLHVTAHRALHDMALVRGVSLLNGPLWSLKWEVVFSLLLPLYVIAGRAYRRSSLLKWVLALGLIAVGARIQSEGATDLPIFGLGVLLACNRAWFKHQALRIPGWIWACLSVVAALALVSTWIGRGILGEQSSRAALVPLEVLGAAAIVFIFTYWASARRLGEARAIQWLGTRSFSLYLVHEPIVVSTAFLLGGKANPLVTLAISVPVALAVANLFYRVIEGPSHRTSQAVGRLVASLGPAQ